MHALGALRRPTSPAEAAPLPLGYGYGPEGSAPGRSSAELAVAPPGDGTALVSAAARICGSAAPDAPPGDGAVLTTATTAGGAGPAAVPSLAPPISAAPPGTRPLKAWGFRCELVISRFLILVLILVFILIFNFYSKCDMVLF